MNVVLISTYELGHQPFGLASPAAWLTEAGASVVCIDSSRQSLDEAAIRHADLVAFYLPMHTATRLAIALVPRIRELNPRAHICFYGLYAPVNEPYLRQVGGQTILGGEFEEGLVRLADRLATRSQTGHGQAAVTAAQSEPVISLSRQKFRVPQRAELPPLKNYAHVIMPDGARRIAGYTEASRGCKHLCRHCPIVPVYDGVFRIVDRETVLSDIRQQISAGAEHITFGDPDFLNGPAHAVAIVDELHRTFPSVTYDVTIKIEHLLKHADVLPRLSDTGCLFVTSAVESVDDAVLEKLDKGHTRADFLRVVHLFQQSGLTLLPTFVPFTPWTTLSGYCDLLQTVAENDLVANVAPIQLAIRLLIPERSRLLDLAEIRETIEPFDSTALAYPWRHADPRVDALAREIRAIVERGEKFGRSRAQIFERVAQAAWDASEATGQPPRIQAASAVPHLSEAWYCCAEPTDDQFVCIKEVPAAAAPAENFI
ncbi:MAG TPA: CUAEP/CCAEP-tail radical SAM protein [Candidatus Acidoferrales bacterium]|nr:CUAEP/CCAEP-tail radical SAM protein [Candidatus Acidoferrales bacterium]